jgi:very-short-patch-repair endonuclease
MLARVEVPARPQPITTMSGQYNRREQLPRRRDLRHRQTSVEQILWKELRCRRLHALKFFRQYGVGPFIVDFYCPEKRLSIELDGAAHYTESGRARDRNRTAYLERLGICELRFENIDVVRDLAGVVAIIERFALARPSWPLRG